MVKKYEPTVKRSFDLWDDEYSYSSEMKESRSGGFVTLEAYNSLLKEHNKLKRKFERYEKRLRLIEDAS